MIQLRLNAEGAPPLYLYGITRHNLEKLQAGQPLKFETERVGGDTTVVVFYGETIDELREECSKVLSAEDLAKLAHPLEQMEAMERDYTADVRPVLDGVRKRMGYAFVHVTDEDVENELLEARYYLDRARLRLAGRSPEEARRVTMRHGEVE